ncbi:hypothetical protein CLV93_102341 [Prolixibacter denitrificans]|uniref:Uncharacterized protein n=1 Tax=Prolixibacter denitrificans TaxID=1541063 RepID=A0A2P8CI03_9BACT|nr:hypothetical protein CLV93_102341 [Prolixibacter denitrificans]
MKDDPVWIVFFYHFSQHDIDVEAIFVRKA